MALYLHNTVQKGEPASYARLKQMIRRNVEHKIRDTNLNARNDVRAFQGAAARGKGTNGKSKKAYGRRIRAKTEKMELVLTCFRKTSVREEIRAAPSTFSLTTRQEQITFSFQCIEKKLERKRKRLYRRERNQRYQSVPKVESAGMLHLSERACDWWHPPACSQIHPKVVAQRG